MQLTILTFILVLYNASAFSIPDSKSQSSISGRIINGQTASIGQFPYQVGVMTKIDSYEPFVQAGGCIISKDYILTVAHAVQFDDIQFIQVHFGVFELENPKEEREIITVYKDGFIVHEDYRRSVNMPFNDIALLKLPETVEFTDKIQPIALPTRADANINMEGSYLRVAGWGRFSDGIVHLYFYFPNTIKILPASQDGAQFLQYTDIPVLNPKICKHFYPDLLPSMLCAYTGYGTATCSGDSGGAVVYTEPKTNRKFVAGLVSFGFFTCLEDGFPKAFTRVTSYLDWIAEHSDIKIL